ncbi:hypothetical protein GCM10027277_34230 [Pseudoduganella ginsengisoli]|uniref:SGNH/GDSL hydrolase family protein n=1 Tax=Pseudoduganella ginsengisoli TaxID=1462440 RepID=A0A6L6Q7I5_9BURK|nr:hypothetical protein [Pseudoduganella ginsengisoli]MTW05555.1 hypothetical protein [Pseudoduganella ginsengisoli]
MGKVYYPGDQDEPGEFCSALAIGDSWFWYPNTNLLETLVRHKRTSVDHANVRLVGYLGAQLQDYVGAGRYAGQVRHWLSPNFNDFSEFYISGAGNDAVDYQLALKPDCTGAASAADCLDPQGADELLRRVSEALGALIHNIRWAYRDDDVTRPIFVHGYDYPTPDNRGFKLGPVQTGPWLAKAMNARNVPQDMPLRCGIMRILIDRLNVEALAPFDVPGNEVHYIDSRGTLRHYPDPAYKSDWTNELHPTSAGFKRIFEQHWIPRLQPYGIVR